MAKRYSPKARKVISSKLHAMKGEKRPRAQKIAIALSTARDRGLKVPKKH
jgi:Family of unknown function (DUF6496)